MRANGEPEISRPPQSGRGKQRKKSRANYADAALARVQTMSQGKARGQDDRRRPEADAFGQCAQKVAPKKVFFHQSHGQERQKPQNAPVDELPAKALRAAEVKHVDQAQRKQEHHQRNESPEKAAA